MKESKQPSFVTNMIQGKTAQAPCFHYFIHSRSPIEFVCLSVICLTVVGHTMAYCYNPRRLGEDPPIEAAECSDGLIRAANNLAGVCEYVFVCAINVCVCVYKVQYVVACRVVSS